MTIIGNRCEFIDKNLVIIHLGTASKHLSEKTFAWLMLNVSARLLYTNNELLTELLLIDSLGDPKVKQDQLVSPRVDCQVIVK